MKRRQPVRTDTDRRRWCAPRVGLTVGLTALLVVVGGTAAVAATPPVGPSVTKLTGERSNATRIPFGISDRVRASVDVATGNLNVQASLLALPGVAGTTPIGLSWNSRDATSGTGAKSDVHADGWTYSLAGAGSLRTLSGASTTIVFTAGDGSPWPFTPIRERVKWFV